MDGLAGFGTQHAVYIIDGCIERQQLFDRRARANVWEQGLNIVLGLT